MIILQKVENTPESEKSWEDFVAKCIKDSKNFDGLNASFLSAFFWGAFEESMGKKVLRYFITQKEEKIGCFTLVIENARRGRYATISGGPLLDYSDKITVKETFQEIRKIAKQEKC